jgi:hypothetical protein
MSVHILVPSSAAAGLHEAI